MRLRFIKPIHGWNSLLSEIGIVVLGVLLALAAQRWVETLDWNNEVKTEREAMHSEIADSLMSLEWRILQQPCVTARLSEILEILERHQRGIPFKLTGAVGSPHDSTTTHGTWDVALSGQALSHMPVEEKLRLSGVIGIVTSGEARLANEERIWVGFARLERPELLTEDDWTALRTTYFEAHDFSERVGKNGDRLLATTVEVSGIKPSELPMLPQQIAKSGRICEKLIRN